MAAANVKLKAAQAALRDAELRRDHASEGVIRAKALVSKANTRASETKTAVAVAVEQRALVLADGDELPSTAVRAARDAEGYAAEAVTDANEALRINEQRFEVAIADIAQSMRDVASARSEVVRAFPYQKLLDEMIATRARLVHLRLIGRVLDRSGDVPPEIAKDFNRELLNTGGLPGGMGAVEFEDWSSHAVSKEWIAWREALLTDADAPMPTI